MKLLGQTNNHFRGGVRVWVVRTETLSTMWVRIQGFPKLTTTLNLEMFEQHMDYLPGKNSLKPGALVAVYAEFDTASFWERAVILKAAGMGYIVFLIDWGIETYQDLSSIRILPRKFTKMPPWARKIRLSGVRDQSEQTERHGEAQMTMWRRTGYLTNIDRSPGKSMTARLLLDRQSGEPPRDMAERWLELGYLDPE
jgi:hypothetical protein